MPEVEVRNLKNEVIETVNLSDAVFGVALNEPLVWEAVQHYLASQRKGSASTKTRDEVRGSGKKPWKQKGTGRARVGSIRSPIWRHGGTVHGPKPRSYAYAFPKKKSRGAMKSALSAKLADSNLMVLDGLDIDVPKTKEVSNVLSALVGASKLLVVDTNESRNFSLGVRNLPHVHFVRGESLNIYDVASHEKILMSKAAALRLQEVLGK